MEKDYDLERQAQRMELESLNQEESKSSSLFAPPSQQQESTSGRVVQFVDQSKIMEVSDIEESISSSSISLLESLKVFFVLK